MGRLWRPRRLARGCALGWMWGEGGGAGHREEGRTAVGNGCAGREPSFLRDAVVGRGMRAFAGRGLIYLGEGGEGTATWLWKSAKEGIEVWPGFE